MPQKQAAAENKNSVQPVVLYSTCTEVMHLLPALFRVQSIRDDGIVAVQIAQCNRPGQGKAPQISELLCTRVRVRQGASVLQCTITN